MTRLIDADALRKNMEFICMSIMAGTDPYNAPLTEIDNAPTVEERPQGKWLTTWDRYIFQCSCCHGKGVKYNFCPECGADMRGADDDTRELEK